MKLSHKTRPGHILLIAVCAAIVAVSAIGTLFHFPGLAVLSEKRDLEKLPDIRRLSPDGIAGRTVPLSEHFQGFITDTVKYYDDNFGLRGVFVFLHNAVKVLVFKASPDNVPVVIGKMNWLYYTGDHNIDYYRNSKKFTAEELACWNATLEAKRRWLAERGIYYLLVIAPSKTTIYPEYLPDSIRKQGEWSLQDQLMQSLSAEMKDHVLDLRQTLRAAKSEALVYNRTDSHWNQEGAYRVYGEIIKKLNERFPRLRVPARSEFTISDSIEKGGDLAETLSLASVLTEKTRSFQPKQPNRARSVDLEYAANGTRRASVFETGDRSLPSAVVLHTSFSNSLKPFLSESFRRTVYLFPSSLRLAMHFETDAIKQEKPDIVIEEIAERRLFRFLPVVPEEMLVSEGISDQAYIKAGTSGR